MIPFPNAAVEPFRVPNDWRNAPVPSRFAGLFALPWRGSITGAPLILWVIATQGIGWDHVSVSVRPRANAPALKRTPTWEELEHVRRLFFAPDETVMQLHVPADEHINCHAGTLHMWRPVFTDIPKPPYWLVGSTSKFTELDARVGITQYLRMVRERFGWEPDDATRSQMQALGVFLQESIEGGAP